MSAACAGGLVSTLASARFWQEYRPVAVGDLAYRNMEEGAPPPQVGMSDATWNLVNTVLRCFTTVLGIAMLAYVLVSRFVYHDPETQDAPVMLLLVALAFFVMGAGYVPKYCEET